MWPGDESCSRAMVCWQSANANLQAVPLGINMTSQEKTPGVTTKHDLRPHRFQVLVQQLMSSTGGSLQLIMMLRWNMCVALAIYRMQVEA